MNKLKIGSSGAKNTLRGGLRAVGVIPKASPPLVATPERKRSRSAPKRIAIVRPAAGKSVLYRTRSRVNLSFSEGARVWLAPFLFRHRAASQTGSANPGIRRFRPGQ